MEKKEIKKQRETIAINRLPGHSFKGRVVFRGDNVRDEPDHLAVSSTAEPTVPMEECEASPTSPAEENTTKRQKLEPFAKHTAPSSPTEMEIPTECEECEPTSIVPTSPVNENNMADDQMLEGPSAATGKRRNCAVVEQLLHKIKEDSRKIGEILKPMKYKMIIGPGSDEAWKTTGDALNDMCSSKLMSIFAEYDIPVISGMPLHRRLRAEKHNFSAWPVDLEPFPAYLAATIELTMQLATLKDAMHCIQTSTTSGKSAAHPAARVVRRKEIITPSQKEEVKTFMQTRDTKIRISRLPDKTTVENSSLEIETYLCEQIDAKRKSEIAHRAMIIYFREQRNNTKHKLVWKTIPCERLLAGDLYRHYSKETAKLLRHGHLHDRDGSVRFKQYADEMYQKMLRPRGGRRGNANSSSPPGCLKLGPN